MKEKNALSLIKGMLKMASATFSSRILGLVREQTMAHYFGASGLTDAFLVAYRIPNLLRDLFAEGAFSSAFIPTFTKVKLESHESSRRLLWSMFFFLGLITLFIGILIFIFSPQLISIFAPEFDKGSEKFYYAVLLTRILSPFLFCISIAALFMGALNTHKVFFIPAIAPALFNAMCIIAVICFSPKSILLLGYGALAGGIAQFLIQIPSIYRLRLNPLIPRPLFTKDVFKIFKLLGPGLLGMAATQINLLISTMLATSFEGAVSWLNYAFRLFQFPIGILGVSLASTNLVHFSKLWRENEEQEAVNLLEFGLKTSLELLAPCALFLIIFANPIIEVVFQRGYFSARDTIHTADLLKIYAYGLLFYGPYKILVPTFYAIGKERIPVYCAVLGILANIIFSLLLTPLYGHSMLAYGAGISILLNTLGLVIFLRHYLGSSFQTLRISQYFYIPIALAIAYGLMILAQSYFSIFIQSAISQLIFKAPILFLMYFGILFLFKRMSK